MGTTRRDEESGLWWRTDTRCEAGGYWCKTIGRRKVGFGPDLELARRRLAEHVSAVAIGADTTLTYSTITLDDVYSEYIDHQHARAKAGEIQPRQFGDTRRFADHFLAFMRDRPGFLVCRIGPRDFGAYMDRLRQKFAPESVNKRVRAVRDMLTFAADEDLLEHAVKFGQRFRPIGGQEWQQTAAGAKAKKKPYTPEQCRRLIAAAPQPLKTMILLALNCAFGPTDCALLPIDRLHLKLERDAAGRPVVARGYHDFPRPKNKAVERRAPLWKLTVLALDQWLRMRAHRVAVKKKRGRRLGDECGGLVFFTLHGRPFVRVKVIETDGRIDEVLAQDSLNPEFAKLCKRLKLPAGFYRLKHTACTWMGRANAPYAECRIRGHHLPGMSRRYVHEVESRLLRRVVRCVYKRLTRKPAAAATSKADGNASRGSPETAGRKPKDAA
jgi:integrase